MQDEFDKLMEFFSYDSSEKEKKLEEIFQRSIDFFERYKHVLVSGTDEEKEAIRKKMEALRTKLKEENERSQARIGLTKEEVKEITSNPKHFTPTQWEFLQKVQDNLVKEKEEQAMQVQLQKEERHEELAAKKKKKPVTKRSSWMKT